jgi:tetratricopeptide (TPR) repeat protein
MTMRVGGITLSSAQTAALAMLLVSGCAMRTEVGMEAPGRPAVTWHSADDDSAQPTSARSGKHVEQQLLAELRGAEAKGSDDLALASSLYNLAILRRQQGRFGEADGLYRRALEIREREEGPNHPDVAATLNNMAALQVAQENYEGARPLLERALAIRQTALGPAHVLTAESLSNLALLFAAQGNATAAEPLYQRALAILETADGHHEDDLERVLDNYAALLHETGRDSAAAALEARARSLGSPVRPVAPEHDLRH